MRISTLLLCVWFWGMSLLGGNEKLTAQQMTDFDRQQFGSWSQELNSGQPKNPQKVFLLFHIGMIYNKYGEVDSARHYMWKALDVPGGKQFQGGRILVNIGNSYVIERNYVEALKYYLEGIEVAEKCKVRTERSNVVRSMANLSECYYNMGNYGQALYYAEEALRKNEEIGDGAVAYILPQAYYILGAVHLERGEVDLAETNMQQTFDLSDALYQSQGSNGGMAIYNAYGMEGLARVHLIRKEYTQALDCATKALDYAKVDRDVMVVGKILATLSDIHLQLKHYEQSRMYALQVLDVNNRAMELFPNISFNLAMVELFAGNREEAARYFRIHSDQIRINADKNFQETMASMETQFETEKKENRIVLLEKQLWLYLMAAMVALLFIVLLWIFFSQKIQRERQEKQLIATNAVLEWEKKERKRFASDLHDGINGMLAAVKFELNTAARLPEVRSRIDDCIETIRRMARGMMPGSLERYGLKAALEDYCRLFPNVHFHFFGDDRRTTEQVELTLYYCAYELINNAFRHSGAAAINVQLIQDGELLSLTVQDNGCGFDRETLTKGAGLKNINDRVATCNGQIDLATTPGQGTEVNIELRTK